VASYRRAAKKIRKIAVWSERPKIDAGAAVLAG
jgi:hypothetical protein